MTRTQRLLSGIATSALSRGVAAIVPIITVPLALRALGATHYGAWAAALSFTAFATFADLGIGAGLMTKLPAAIATEDYRRGQRYVATGYVALGIVTLLGLAAVWALRLVMNWGVAVGGREAEGDSAIELIVLITLSGFIVNVTAMLIVRVQQAAQQIARSNLWQTAGSVAGLLAMLAAVHTGIHGAGFVAVSAFIPAVVSIANTILFFRTDLGRKLSPRIRAFEWSVAKSLMGIGSRFLLITALMGVSLGSDAWIVAHAASLSDVPGYAIPARVFGVIGTAVSVLTVPLWPTSSHAVASGDLEWVTRSTRRLSIVTPAIVGLVSVAGAVLGPTLINSWLGGKVHVEPMLLWGFALWNVAQAVVGPAFMVQNAVGVLKPQIIGYAVLVILVPVKWLAVTTIGTTWVPFVTTAGYCLAIWPAAISGYRRSMRLVYARRESVRSVASGIRR